MPILAIDTATKGSGAAIIENGNLLAEFSFCLGKTHSQRFLPMLEALLQGAECQLQDMDAIALTVGPGSFTGLRIGIATAKAWGQALQKPLIPIITLDALAQNAEKAHFAVPILDARKNEVYCCLYHNGQRLWDYCAKEPLKLAEELSKMPDCSIFEFMGDGTITYFSCIQEVLGERAILSPPPRRLFMASAVAVLAEQAWQEHKVTDSFSIEPFYLRLSEAENRLLAKGKEGSHAG